MNSADSADLGKAAAIRLNIRDRAVLYAAYMSWVTGGGLFIPTARDYPLGQEILMMVTLPEDPAPYPVSGAVVWISPPGAQNGRVQGVGVQFAADDAGKRIRLRIEELLAGQLSSTQATHTL